MTPPPRRSGVFGGTPPSKRKTPHPCPFGRMKPRAAPHLAGRRFPFVPPRSSTRDAPMLYAGTVPSGLRKVYGKERISGKNPRRRTFYTVIRTRPARIPRLRFARFELVAADKTPGTSATFPPFRARAREGPAPQTAGAAAPQAHLGLRKIYGKPEPPCRSVPPLLPQTAARDSRRRMPAGLSVIPVPESPGKTSRKHPF